MTDNYSIGDRVTVSADLVFEEQGTVISGRLRYAGDYGYMIHLRESKEATWTPSYMITSPKYDLLTKAALTHRGKQSC